MDKELYQRLVGKLIYMTYMRPYLSYEVSVVSQFMHIPSYILIFKILSRQKYLVFEQ